MKFPNVTIPSILSYFLATENCSYTAKMTLLSLELQGHVNFTLLIYGDSCFGLCCGLQDKESFDCVVLHDVWMGVQMCKSHKQRLLWKNNFCNDNIHDQIRWSGASYTSQANDKKLLWDWPCVWLLWRKQAYETWSYKETTMMVSFCFSTYFCLPSYERCIIRSILSKA